MLNEFREFIQRGNVLDLAVGVIIGGAFGKIVTSMVDDVIMPTLSPIAGKVALENYFLVLDPNKSFETLAEAKKAGVAVIAYGAFLNAVVQFLLIAFSVFLIVKVANRVKRAAEEAALLSEPKVAEPAKEDPQTKLIAQNERVIELLEQIAEKRAV